MLRLVSFWLVVAALLPLRAIAASEISVTKSPKEASGDPKSSAVSSSYVLQPQDLIRVQIYKQEGLNRDLRISQEGKITLPLIGPVDLNGKTVLQAQELIRGLYDADYFVNPQINVTVLEYAPRRVYITGAVEHQGAIDFPKEEGLTLLAAVSGAGPTRLANKKAVILKRTLPDGRTETNKINVDDLLKGDSNETWPLQPGDVITVPERAI
jgi:polysaccharide export outer membrane protein